MVERLVVRELSIEVDGQRLFEPVNLSVEAGQIRCVAGPSGRGKSSLLRAIAQLLVSTGTVLIDGQPPEAIGWPTFRRRVLYVHQQAPLVPGSVRENLVRPFTYRTAERNYEEASATALLARFGLERALLDRSAKTLSVGESQRVALVRALLVRPSVLLLDEPTSALDADHRAEVERLILEYVQETGSAALVVTHDLAQAARLSSTPQIELRAPDRV